MSRAAKISTCIAGVALVGLVAGAAWMYRPRGAKQRPGGDAVAISHEPAALAGSVSCRECHQKFYELWSTSHHGLAMQPFTKELARAQLTGEPKDIRAGEATYRPEIGEGGGFVVEKGPGGEKRYPMLHLLGGKNIYYFLTSLERGKLQVLPVAYDLRRKEWFDTAASAMRHFQSATDRPLDWHDPLYTFNTACHGCHVSQFANNYDLKSDSYHTTWAEPGINCETCHGPSGEHVKAYKQAAISGQKPAELKLISTKPFTPEQHNSSCSSCHAKAGIITNSFKPGDRFFDHFDLTTLEHADYYPDGRDLGENYTYTSWRMNPCAKSGQLHCVHCHTSSGRNRFEGEKANDACLPCHAERVKNATAHTRHKPDSAGNKCVACHMPMTEFARMRRSDHSFRPPMPAATAAFKSPNACNVCHTDKDAAWADQQARSWHKDDYQAETIRVGHLVAAARRGDWSRLPEMLAYLGDPKHEEIFAASLVRLLGSCPDPSKIPALVKAMKAGSPLVRSAAAVGLTGSLNDETVMALLEAAGDEYRLVRIRAASTLVGYPTNRLGPQARAQLASATAELEASMKARPDDWGSHYNLGNYYVDLGRLRDGIESFKIAAKLRQDAVQPWVNLAIAQARLGQSEAAAAALVKAVELEPANAVANLNLGLLRAEQGDLAKAEQHLRAALKSEPGMAQAAYNLAVILAKDRMPEAIEFCRKAAAASPGDRRISYTLAFYLNQAGRSAEAVDVLTANLARDPGHGGAYALLGEIHEKSGQRDKALDVYRRALVNEQLDPEDRQFLQARARALSSENR